MPVRTKKQRDKYRVIEAKTGKIVTNAKGTPVDGGGHIEREDAEAQARAINAHLARQGRA